MLPCQSQERVQQQKLWWSNRWEIARHEKLTWYTRFLKGKAKTGFYGRLRSAQLLLRTGDSDTVAVTDYRVSPLPLGDGYQRGRRQSSNPY
ncbi:Hypothetical predicted protein [Podarcis lilfordi]|uniref:Uncharacterized protein n=1 Tax=Podarcis lilfordi TaxID=74358 RepID=A0AA35KF75_9SAUR|nr:Hypothetical predicted protein [Podarcis lilfordi]